MGINRRDFLSIVGAGSAISATSGLLGCGDGKPPSPKQNPGPDQPPTPSDPVLETKIIPSWCHGCGSFKTNCAVLCHVVNGRFVKVEGNPDAGNNYGYGSTSLCLKSYSAAQYQYDPLRLRYPMKLVGPKGEGAQHVRITWDEALDTIANKLKEVKDIYGPEAYAWLSPESCAPLNTMARRFLNVYGSPNYLHSAICATNRSTASQITVGFQSEAPGDWTDSKLIVIWGCNPENATINRGKANLILDALDQGCKLIDIRPMFEPLGSTDKMWLGLRPGTDCALALAILNVIITELPKTVMTAIL